MLIMPIMELPPITAPVWLKGPATIDGSQMTAYIACLDFESHDQSTVDNITVRNCGTVGFFISCGANHLLRNVVSHSNLFGIAVDGCSTFFVCDNCFASNNIGGGLTSDGLFALVRGGWFGVSPDGMSAWGNQNFGVQLTGVGSSITRALVSGNKGHGIVLDSSENITVANCVVGLSALENIALPNSQYGVHITFSATRASVLNSTISGNGQFGIFSQGLLAWIEGNRVGVDSTTQIAFANILGGVSVFSSNATIFENVVSGNFGSGISIMGTFVVAKCNIFGMDLSKTVALPNHNKACFISGSFCVVDNNFFAESTLNRNIDAYR